MVAQSSTGHLQSDYRNVGWRQEGNPAANKTNKKATNANSFYERENKSKDEVNECLH